MLSQLLTASTRPDGRIHDFRRVLSQARTYLNDHEGAMEEWLDAISAWITSFEVQSPQTSLRQTWEQAAKMYRLTPVTGTSEFVDIVTSHRTLTGQELDRMGWPDYYMPDVRRQLLGWDPSTDNNNTNNTNDDYDTTSHENIYLRQGRRSDRRARPETTSLVTRSGFDGPALLDARQAVREWSVASRYIQQWMRAGIDEAMGLHEKQAKDILMYMHHRCPRVPTQPAGYNKQFIYRGLSGSEATSLERTGRNEDPGFMAFSTESWVSRRYAEAGGAHHPIMRLAVGDIPQGTPWLWFDTGRNPTAAFSFNREVLLGPGTLTVIGPEGNVPLEQNMLPVRYEPNRALQQSILNSVRRGRVHHQLP